MGTSACMDLEAAWILEQHGSWSCMDFNKFKFKKISWLGLIDLKFDLGFGWLGLRYGYAYLILSCI